MAVAPFGAVVIRLAADAEAEAPCPDAVPLGAAVAPLGIDSAPFGADVAPLVAGVVVLGADAAPLGADVTPAGCGPRGVTCRLRPAWR
jgi:hypothetical protein